MKAEFISQMIERRVLQFGDFVLKSGRKSPYFFNLGMISDGAGLALLGAAYAAAVRSFEPLPEVVFGPAYKGIPIAVATTVALDGGGTAAGVAFNRKEAKDHGEGGSLVGADLAGRRVVIVDDVVTAGTAVTEAAGIIGAAGAELVGIVVALDREEVDAGRTAVENLSDRLGVPVKSIASLTDLMDYLDGDTHYADARDQMARYRQLHCRVPG